MRKYQKTVALILLFLFALVPLADARQCPTGCCAGNCNCRSDCDEPSPLDDIIEAFVGEFAPPGVGTLWEIGKQIYENWDAIVDFFTPDSDSGSCSCD